MACGAARQMPGKLNADFNCSSGPGLVSDYTGTPTGYGAGVKTHLQSLAGG